MIKKSIIILTVEFYRANTVHGQEPMDHQAQEKLGKHLADGYSILSSTPIVTEHSGFIFFILEKADVV